MSVTHGNMVGAYEAKTRFSELLEEVASSGREITITRHGTAVAKLVPVRKKLTVEERRAAIERMIQAREKHSLGGLKIRDLIDEGRP